MLKLAICDDEEQELASVAELLKQYGIEKNENIVYDTFQNPIELLAAVQKGQSYDILLLDIIMPGTNGIETAREVREIDRCVKIIFLTSSPEFALESYSVGAYYYQLKPVCKENLFELLAEASAEISAKCEDSIIVKSKTGITRIPLAQLEYCEVIGKTLFFHLASGKVIESTGNITKVSDSLIKYGNFFRAHRSYIVNLDFVAEITSRTVTMTCLTNIPLPRGKFSQIKDAFLERAFQKGWDYNG